MLSHGPQSSLHKIQVASLGLCFAVLLLTPFECLGPIIALPGQNLTNLELLLALSIGIWGLASLLSGRISGWRTPLTFAWIALLLIMGVSAIAAPEHRQNALHFTGRCGAGFLFFLIVSDLANSTRRIVTMISLIVCAGSIVGLLGVLEYLRLPAVLELLSAFRVGPSYAVGQTRVSSTLQYPTIASMYLEIVFALGTGLLVWSLERGKRGISRILLASQFLVGSAAILTLTRGGLLSLVLTLGLAGVVCYREWGIDGKSVAIGILAAGLSLVSAATLYHSQEARLRLTTIDQAEWYRVEYEAPSTLFLRSGELRLVEVTLRNTGQADWQPEGVSPFRLSYHWLTKDGSAVADWEGVRTRLPRAVRAGEELVVSAQVRAPLLPGQYQLAWDLVQEYRFWFSKEGSPSATTQVEVRGEALADHEYSLSSVPASRFLIGRRELWSIAGWILRDHPWLGLGPDNFRLTYGRYAGLKIFDFSYHTHNTVLEFFVNTGILGGSVFLWIVWILLRLSGRALHRSSGEGLALSLGVAAALLSILSHGLFDYFFEFTPTNVSIFTVFAFTVAVVRVNRPDES